MDRQRFLIPALAVITVWRWALLPTMELSPAEALAVLHAQRPDFWHLEMGPLTPWLVRLGMFLCGHTELGVRLFAPFLAFLSSVMLWRLSRGVGNQNVASWAVVALQVMPAFNIAATTMTSSIVGMTAVLGVILGLRLALQRSHPRHPAWFFTAFCIFAAILADWRNILAYLAVLAILAGTPRRRHHLGSQGFLAISTAVVIASGACLWWNQLHGWPMLEVGSAAPDWRVFTNMLRWIILASPLALTLILWALPESLLKWQQWPEHAAVLTFLIPYALLDFLWGPTERWPSVGWPIWMALGGLLVTDHSVGMARSRPEHRALWRTGGFLVTAIFCGFILRSDAVRSISIPWPLADYSADAKSTWSRWFMADPSGRLMGWHQGAQSLESVLSSAEEHPYFVIASNWELAAATEFYLPKQVPVLQPTARYPKIHSPQGVSRSSPHSLWPRYDSVTEGEEPFAGRDALYITDDPSHEMPQALRRMFSQTRAIAVQRVMHGGMEVRVLKIFACQNYLPPEF